MPTLFEKSKIVKQKWMTHKELTDIDSEQSIKFIVSWIADRVSTDGTKPKIPSQKPGSRVLVLRSGTGSGKSTTVPVALYNTWNKNVLITQPTRATTTEIPFDIIKWNPNLRLGDNIGYQTGTISRKATHGIQFCTTGVLLQFLRIMDDDAIMKKFKFIIIDEVHHRSMDTDLSLFYLKQFLSRNYSNERCPFVILMSGTFDPDIFMNYFRCPKEHFIEVLGMSYPVADKFTDWDLTHYMSYVVDLIEKLHLDGLADITENKKIRDILVFVQGKAVIKKLTNAMHKLNSILAKGVDVAKEHSAVQWKKYTGGAKTDRYFLAPIGILSENMSKGTKEYMDLFSDIANVTVPLYDIAMDQATDDLDLATVKQVGERSASRRVMFATNAIETGMTIDTLKYCIDTGLVQESHFNPNYGCQVLVTRNITQANSRQRRGRVGRSAPGEFYACYTKKSYELLPSLPFPDIIKEDISVFLLNFILQTTKTELIEVERNMIDGSCFQMNQFDQQWYKLNYDAVFYAKNLDFIQHPAADSLSYSLEKLHGLGFVDHEYKPTLFGYYAAKFRKLSLENIRMILAGYATGANCLDLITIACCLQQSHAIGIKRSKYKPRNPLNVSDAESAFYNKYVWADEFIEWIFIWDEFMQTVSRIGDQMEKNFKSGKQKTLPVKYLTGWAEENGFKLDGLYDTVALRDEIIADMITIGLNPYYNGLGLNRGSYNLVKILRSNLTEGMDEIIKIKQCIIEGYRFNICQWTDSAYYCPQKHANIVCKSPLIKATETSDKIKQTRPQKIIVSGITLMEGNNGYEFSASEVSVLDGFVDLDGEFLNW